MRLMDNEVIHIKVPHGHLVDSMPELRAALDIIREKGGGKLGFEPSRYHFYPEAAYEKYLFVTNNDPGLKSIAFLLDGISDLEINGNGAEFIFHGYLNPFVLSRCRYVVLRNFSIDFQRPFHSEGLITAFGEGSVEVEFSDEFPFVVANGRLRFTGAEGDPSIHEWRRLLEFDTARRETAFMAEDYWSRWFIEEGLIPDDGTGNFFGAVAAVQTEPRRVRLAIPGFKAKLGNTLYFGPGHRLVPGITFSDCRGVRLEDVSVHHCGGMGIVAQRTEEISLDHVTVAPKPGGVRIVSATADATHFANCSGTIRLTDCVFENQLDDATNIHGNYARIRRLISPQQIEIETVHPQHHGFDVVRTGEMVEFASAGGMVAIGQGVARFVKRLNTRLNLVELEESLPADVKVGDVLASLSTASPEVVIQRCRIGNNRARGILLGSSGKTVVENNRFHTPGAAVLFEGDGRYWFERAAVRDVTIRNNLFENCNFGVWGNGTIESSPNIDPTLREGNACHRNIQIDGNTFQVFDGTPLLHLSCVDKVNFYSNILQNTSDYPCGRSGGSRFVVEHGSLILLEEPASSG